MGLEQRTDRGADQSTQDAQATDVRPRRPGPDRAPVPTRRMITKSGQEPKKEPESQRARPARCGPAPQPLAGVAALHGCGPLRVPGHALVGACGPTAQRAGNALWGSCARDRLAPDQETNFSLFTPVTVHAESAS